MLKYSEEESMECWFSLSLLCSLVAHLKKQEYTDKTIIRFWPTIISSPTQTSLPATCHHSCVVIKYRSSHGFPVLLQELQLKKKKKSIKLNR